MDEPSNEIKVWSRKKNVFAIRSKVIYGETQLRLRTFVLLT
jgi:hypothetical protein